MDTAWGFRSASVSRSLGFVPGLTSTLRYDHARQIKVAQDGFCAKASTGDWAALAGQKFPEDLQWEALVDTLRGRVKVTRQTSANLVLFTH